MWVKAQRLWLERIVLALLLSTAGAPVAAQTSGESRPDLETVLIPGSTVWITDASGREEKMQVIGVSGGVVSASAGEEMRRILTSDVTRVRARRSDNVINGALIGAGAFVATGLFMCRMMEPWEVCNNPGGYVRSAAVGAGIGIGIDALIRGRKTIYDVEGARLRAGTLVAPGKRGVQVSLSF